MNKIKEVLNELSEPDYRYKQFLTAYYKDLIDDIDNITVWPLELRQRVKKSIDLKILESAKEITSKNKDTIKILFKGKDGKQFETVLMKHKDGRNTVCVSCMIGCPVGCVFCATGKMGFIRNLLADEIVEQVLYCARIVKKDGNNITNIVFMGMGEPMLNLSEVQKSIAILTDPAMFGIGDKRITVSTSGYIIKLKEFIRSGYRGRLAVSLHAPDQRLRKELMPVARNNSLEDLFKVLDEYVSLTNKRITYEYVLLKGINDTPYQAKVLAQLLKGRLAHVNLIPYNTIRDVEFKTSLRSSIFEFQDILDRYGIHNSIRVTMGSDVGAACGQLAGLN